MDEELFFYDNIKESMENNASLVAQIDEGRLAVLENYKRGGSVDRDVLSAIANAMEIVSGVFGGMIDGNQWAGLMDTLKEGNYSEEVSDEMVRWEESITECIGRMEKEYRYCNICGKRVMYLPKGEYFREEQKKYGFPYWNRIFESLGRNKCFCPACRSMDRERMIALFLDLLKPEGTSRLKVLQIAPSHALHNWLCNRPDIEYETTDLKLAGVTFQADIQDMYMVADASYDVIICSHIMEHVEDDRKAMRELKRILKEDGVCLFLVPLVIGLEETDEEFGLTAEENWRRFGQDDHARLYAKEDFLNRLTEAGYRVHALGRDYFGQEKWEQAGLTGIHWLYAATKTDIGIGVEPYRMAQSTGEELVSVILPAYNRGYCIERSIQSVLNQSWRNLELIVVDDGSGDNTKEVVAQCRDDRIRYIRLERNRGANYARNIGIKEAKGAYIAFNDSDDVWLPRKLEKQMKLLKLEERTSGAKTGVVYCMFRRFEEGEESVVTPDEQNLCEDFIGELYGCIQEKMFISTQVLLVRREVFEQAGYFDEKIKRFQDWELLLRIAQHYRFSMVQEILAEVYVQEDSVSRNDKDGLDTIFYVLDRHRLSVTNKPLYERWVRNSVQVMTERSYSKEFLWDKVKQIREQGYFTEVEMKEMERRLQLTEGNGYSDGEI